MAVSRPIPSAAPVTKATLFLIDLSIIFYLQKYI
jgi:hypothetical protein